VAIGPELTPERRPVSKNDTTRGYAAIHIDIITLWYTIESIAHFNHDCKYMLAREGLAHTRSIRTAPSANRPSAAIMGSLAARFVGGFSFSVGPVARRAWL
jgi:hypothetical protein